MRTYIRLQTCLAAFAAITTIGVAQVVYLKFPDGEGTSKSATDKAKDRSHSHYTSAFNTGPRQQAKLLSGIGNAHFPITCKNLLVQKFFDQGLNQFYSFMYYEAERSFRQAVMLEPDNPMPFWGLALNDSSKAAECLKLAQERKFKASPRERRFIEALALLHDKDAKGDKSKPYRAALEKIVLDYPDDIEAKLLLAEELWQSVDRSGGERSAVDALLKDVIQANPMHPAANHFRIHLWDGPDAKAALDSCAAYPKAAPAIGHAQHMPGHIYSQLGMWEEAAYQMDAATRVERKYMMESRQLPSDTWNYSHNQHYLITNLGYAGRIEEGERLARELINAPRDPRANMDNDFSLLGEGRTGMLRMWLRGEQWDKILEDERTGWPSLPKSKTWRLFAKANALLGKGNLAEAEKAVKELEELKSVGDGPKCALAEAKGRLLILQGKNEEGIAELKRAFDIEKEKFTYNDPGPYPRPASESLVWGYLRAGKPAEAEKAARTSLEYDPHSGFILSLLAESLQAQGKSSEVGPVVEQFKTAFSHASPNLTPIKRLRELRLLGNWAPKPYDPPRALERCGPIAWEPFEMADCSLTDSSGTKVRLADNRGKNLILVFIISGSCEHCIEQLETFGKEKDEWAKLNSQVVVVSPDKPETLRNTFKDRTKFPFPFLSDPDHRAAKLYKAYDEFENLELHATVYITPKGKVWWYRSGSQPFTDMKFLKGEIERVTALKPARS